MEIIQRNKDSYLDAGDVLNTRLYFAMFVFFFLTGLVWLALLRRSKDQVYKIHHLMTILVFLKSFSLLFHGVNFYFIGKYGHQQEVWAVVYYIMHLLKGAMLFGVVILIGTGWTFFKHFLTSRDKKIFMIIIPLQVLDNIALIIVEESEIGQKYFRFWFQLFIFVDLICCAAIILPVIWSIRHLQEASATDGKAAFNLEKLKLFRHFYIMIICYIYLTRILKYLVWVLLALFATGSGCHLSNFKFTVPFKYTWLMAIVEELGTWVFFAVSGYKFRPISNNPYLKLSQSEEEYPMDEALTQSGAVDSVVRVKRRGGGDVESCGVPLENDANAGGVSRVNKSQEESSHEYD